jgi:hypothetical protein
LGKDGALQKNCLRSSGKYGILRPKPDVAARTHNGRTVWMFRPEPAHAILYKTRAGRVRSPSRCDELAIVAVG